MKELYFTRHGQTFWNVENKICGATDIALTPLGHEQAVAAGKLIREGGYAIDEILYSPLVRAAETARHISEETGIPMREEPRLKEQNFGIYEGTARNGEEFRRAKACFINHFGSGESMLQMAQRIYNLLDEIKHDPSGRTYLLVAHNGIARIVQSYFREMTNEEFAAFGIDNCSLLEFDLCTEEEQTIYTITRIEEADFGCEGRPEGYVPMVKVYLKDEQGMERVLEMEDAMMYQRKLDEGARVVIGSDKTLHATEKGR